MDIDAKKNQIDFKVFGKGERVHCSLKEGLNINDFTYLLGKWVTLSGQVSLKNEKVLYIEVEKIKEEETPDSEKKQGELI